MISVLFVDDNTDLLVQIRTFLEKTGEMRLESVHSIKHAIEKLKGRTFDVIVSYEQIPEVNGIEFVSDMNGIEFLKYLKSQGNTTPVLLLGRRGGNKVALQEVYNGIEITLPKSGDPRQYLVEIVSLIKQTTLRKKAERELKVQNEQLATILSATPLGIFQVRNGLLEWVNRPFLSMLGFEESSLIGKEVKSLFRTPEEYDQVCREFLIRHDSRGLGYSECRLLKKDGSFLPVHLQVNPLDSRDTTKGGTFIATDITEKQKVTEALKESEAKYRDVLQNTQSIIIRMDTQGNITFFNFYALTFFDYTSDEVIGRNVVGTIVPQKSRVQHDLSMMANDLGFNAEGYAVNVNENVRRNGDRVWIAWINKAIRDEQGRITEILCIGNDITDRKRSGQVRIRYLIPGKISWSPIPISGRIFSTRCSTSAPRFPSKGEKESRSAPPFLSGTPQTYLKNRARSFSTRSRGTAPNCGSLPIPNSRKISRHWPSLTVHSSSPVTGLSRRSDVISRLIPAGSLSRRAWARATTPSRPSRP